MEQNEPDPSEILKEFRIKNISRLVTAHLNINHIAGKFDQLKEIIQENIDILILSETKIDRDKNGGGVLVYVREGIPYRELKRSPGTENIEGIFLEISLRKTNWLLFAGYNRTLPIKCRPN